MVFLRLSSRPSAERARAGTHDAQIRTLSMRPDGSRVSLRSPGMTAVMLAITLFHGQSAGKSRKHLAETQRNTPMAASGWSRTWTFFDGDWHEGNVGIFGPRTHAAWLGSSVFDGARAFEGVVPDVDLHCVRINSSAPKLGLKATVSSETWMGLVADG